MLCHHLDAIKGKTRGEKFIQLSRSSWVERGRCVTFVTQNSSRPRLARSRAPGTDESASHGFAVARLNSRSERYRRFYCIREPRRFRMSPQSSLKLANLARWMWNSAQGRRASGVENFKDFSRRFRSRDGCRRNIDFQHLRAVCVSTSYGAFAPSPSRKSGFLGSIRLGHRQSQHPLESLRNLKISQEKQIRELLPSPLLKHSSLFRICLGKTNIHSEQRAGSQSVEEEEKDEEKSRKEKCLSCENSLLLGPEISN
jgi:hypothetical protein